jgi:anti-sigma factor RsiW
MPKRQRTIDLVQQSVDALRKDKQRVSLATVAAKSKELDADHRGISESAILDNPEARAYYEQHRSWRGSSRKRAKPLVAVPLAQPPGVKPDRDEQRVRQRYLRMSKEALVERLLVVERNWAEQQERWLVQQDEVLTWRLRAEAAEVRIKSNLDHDKMIRGRIQPNGT